MSESDVQRVVIIEKRSDSLQSCIGCLIGCAIFAVIMFFLLVS